MFAEEKPQYDYDIYIIFQNKFPLLNCIHLNMRLRVLQMPMADKEKFIFQRNIKFC